MSSLDDVGKLILRLAVGGLLLLHGIAKLGAGGLQGIQGMLAAKGLPELLAYGVYLGEVLAPVLIIVGYFTRPAGVVLAMNMVMAIALAHAHQLVLMNEQSGGLQLELQYLYLLGGVAIALLGAGNISASRGNGKWD